jgi:hypothetical protein
MSARTKIMPRIREGCPQAFYAIIKPSHLGQAGMPGDLLPSSAPTA